jgi:two-component system, OmpR family, KDP operon response regulator KdpE
MSRVLVIEDELPMRRALDIALSARGYDVQVVDNGGAGLDAALSRPPDLIILDLGLPDIDGVDVARRLRGDSAVPIIVVSAREAEEVKVAALDAGADDYVTKPFGMEELLARLRSALRRASPPGEAVTVATADFSIDLGAKQVVRDGAVVHLTPTEWRIVEVLASNRGKLITQTSLLQQVWGPMYHDETHYLRIYLRQIRHKLEPTPSRPQYFITEPGVGYRFVWSDQE